MVDFEICNGNEPVISANAGAGSLIVRLANNDLAPYSSVRPIASDWLKKIETEVGEALYSIETFRSRQTELAPDVQPFSMVQSLSGGVPDTGYYVERPKDELPESLTGIAQLLDPSEESDRLTLGMVLSRNGENQFIALPSDMLHRELQKGGVDHMQPAELLSRYGRSLLAGLNPRYSFADNAGNQVGVAVHTTRRFSQLGVGERAWTQILGGVTRQRSQHRDTSGKEDATKVLSSSFTEGQFILDVMHGIQDLLTARRVAERPSTNWKAMIAQYREASTASKAKFEMLTQGSRSFVVELQGSMQALPKDLSILLHDITSEPLDGEAHVFTVFSADETKFPKRCSVTVIPAERRINSGGVKLSRNYVEAEDWMVEPVDNLPIPGWSTLPVVYQTSEKYRHGDLFYANIFNQLVELGAQTIEVGADSI